VLGWAARERNLRPSVQRIFNEVIVADTGTLLTPTTSLAHYHYYYCCFRYHRH